MAEEWEKISNMDILRGSFAHMGMQGLVPLQSGAVMVNGAILHHSVKVRLNYSQRETFEIQLYLAVAEPNSNNN